MERRNSRDTIRGVATTPPPSTTRLEIRAALLSIVVGVLLLIVKFTAYALTGSTAIFSDALESVVNVLASGFALYAVQLAHQPADAKHPYGHGKVEFMSAGFEGGLVLVAAIVIIARAGEVLLLGKLELEQLGLGIWLMAGAMLANGATGLYLIRVGRRHGSLALEADGKHLLSDALTSVAAIMALLFIKLTGWAYADPIVALLIAAYIGHMSVGLLRRSFAGLMDEQDLEDARLLKELLEAHIGAAGRMPRICSYHKLRHRHAGRYHWVDFHIMVPGGLSIEQGHAIASTIEYEIEKALGPGNATAHVEPCEDASCELCRSNVNAPPPVTSQK